MLEAMSNHNFQFSDDNLQSLDQNKDVKLPRIDRPISKNQPSVQKSSTKFPSLKVQLPSYHSNPAITQPQHSVIPINTNTYLTKKNTEEQAEEDFVVEVEKKLKMVLEEQNLVDLEDSSYSSDDFQQKINENKQIIKKHKQKLQNQIHSNNFINLQNPVKNKLSKKQQKQPVKNKNRNESLYQKRAKEYREASGENKYLQKKKEIAVVKALQDLGTKETQSKQSIAVNKVIQLKVAEKQKQKPVMETSYKNQQQLFDNIQNFLQNPKKSSIDVQSIKIPNHKRARKEIQDKIREIQFKINSQKLNIQHKAGSSDTLAENRLANTPSSAQVYHAASIHEWQKVELVKNKIEATQTTFDKEVERINRYLERGQNSLEKYVQNHKMLLQLQLWKRNKVKSISDQKVNRRTEE